MSGATLEEATVADEGAAGRTHVHASLQYPWTHQTPTSHCSPASMRALPQTGGRAMDEVCIAMETALETMTREEVAEEEEALLTEAMTHRHVTEQ